MNPTSTEAQEGAPTTPGEDSTTAGTARREDPIRTAARAAVARRGEGPATFSEADGSVGVGLGGACPTCHAAIDVGQTYCLECGAHTGRFPRKRTAQGRRAPAAHPGMPMPRKKKFPWVPLVILTLLVVSGLTYALLASDQDSSTETTAAPGTTSERIIPDLTDTPSREQDETAADDGVRFPDASTDADADGSDTRPDGGLQFPEDDAAAGDGGGAASGDWPAGQTGFTVVVASYSKDTYQRTTADQRSVQLQAQGFDAGVLDSDDFSRLSPGFWVVFSGTHPTRAEADRALDEVRRAGNTGAYVREIA